MVPRRPLVASLLGWLQRAQQEVIPYLREADRVLKARIHDQRFVHYRPEHNHQGLGDELTDGVEGQYHNGRVLRRFNDGCMVKRPPRRP